MLRFMLDAAYAYMPPCRCRCAAADDAADAAADADDFALPRC